MQHLLILACHHEMRPLLLLLTLLAAVSPVAAQYEASLVADINPSAEGSIEPAVPDRDYFSPTVYDGRLFFNATDGQSGYELWAYDAATGEAILAADVWPGSGSSFPTDLAVYDDRLFFAANDSTTGRELWVYDAATGKAALAADINTGSDYPASPQSLTVYDGRLFFNAYASLYGFALWAYDAVTGEATLAANPASGPDLYPFHLIVYDDRLFFSAENVEFGRELWVYDAATDEATLAADLIPGPSRSLGDDLGDSPAVYDDRLFLITYFGTDLWSYDASTNEASFVADHYGYWLAVYDECLFANGDGLIAYDASTGEVTTVADEGGAFLTVYDDKLFFSAGEVWNYDAEIGETSFIADINPGDSSYPQGFIVYDGRLFFNADDGTHGRELWALSPTPVANEPAVTPQSAHLHAPHPNPAQDRATITFAIDEPGAVRVEMLDVLGRRVALLADGPVAAGEHTLRWEAGMLPSGIYLVRLTAGDTVQTQRLTLVR